MEEKLTPRKLLAKLEMEANDPISKARAEGARLMLDKYNEKAQLYRDTHREHNRIYQREYHRRYRDTHREHNRIYQREYHRKMRAKKKGEQDKHIDISN